MEGLVKLSRASGWAKIDILVYNSVTNVKDRALTRADSGHLGQDDFGEPERRILRDAGGAASMRQRGAGHLIYVCIDFGHRAGRIGSVVPGSETRRLGMAHAVRVEEKENGIRTCVVCPGLVDTGILENRPREAVGGDARPRRCSLGDVAEVILGVAKLPARAVVPEIQGVADVFVSGRG